VRFYSRLLMGENWLCGAASLHGLFFILIITVMAYTSTDIDNIRAAIVTIATKGAAEVEISGRRVRFIDIAKLQAFLKTVEAEVNGNSYGACIPVKFTEISG